MTTARTCLLIVGWGKKAIRRSALHSQCRGQSRRGFPSQRWWIDPEVQSLVGFSDQDKAEPPCRKAEPHLPAWPRDPSQEVAMPYLGAELMV